jgi:hypothetical protein
MDSQPNGNAEPAASPPAVVDRYEAIPATAIESLTRAETDAQITTAKRYPRSLAGFKAAALQMATLDPDTAASCFYVLPREGKKIEGPGVRLAEICASAWGNLRFGARIVSEDDRFIVAQGTCHDLQTNVATSIEVRRRIRDRHGRKYSDDMVGVTSNAACAIALRNAVFKVIPKAFVEPIYLAAKRAAVGDEKTLGVRRDAAIAHFASLGVDKERVLAKLERQGIEDVTLKDLEVLRGLATAIGDGDTTVGEAFALPAPATPEAKVEGTKGDQLAEQLALK